MNINSLLNEILWSGSLEDTAFYNIGLEVGRSHKARVVDVESFSFETSHKHPVSSFVNIEKNNFILSEILSHLIIIVSFSLEFKTER